MAFLTDAQLKELNQLSGGHLILVDPRNQIEYVLLPRNEYERLVSDAIEESDLQEFLASTRKNLWERLEKES